MKRILSSRNREVLSRLARSRVLLAFDFDGTLAPLVSDRGAAIMRRKTGKLLKQLCSRYPCAVISGRARDDVAERIAEASVKYIVGNHGLEPGGDLRAFKKEIAEIRPALLKALEAIPGTEFEDKRYSLAVHYRRSPNKRTARAAIERAVRALPRAMRVVPGKLVLNILPERSPDKGDAMLDLLDRERASAALYVGDDVTDEDVFRIGRPSKFVGVRVGESRSSNAHYYLRDQGEIDELLELLVEFRRLGASA